MGLIIGSENGILMFRTIIQHSDIAPAISKELAYDFSDVNVVSGRSVGSLRGIWRVRTSNTSG